MHILWNISLIYAIDILLKVELSQTKVDIIEMQK